MKDKEIVWERGQYRLTADGKLYKRTSDVFGNEGWALVAEATKIARSMPAGNEAGHVAVAFLEAAGYLDAMGGALAATEKVKR